MGARLQDPRVPARLSGYRALAIGYGLGHSSGEAHPPLSSRNPSRAGEDLVAVPLDMIQAREGLTPLGGLEGPA